MLVEDVISAILKGPGQGLNTPQSVNYANAFACILRVNRNSIEYANSILYLEDVRSDLEAKNKELLERSLNLAVDCEGLRREVEVLQRRLFDCENCENFERLQTDKIDANIDEVSEGLQERARSAKGKGTVIGFGVSGSWESADLGKRQAACHQNPRSDNDTKW